MSTIRNKRLLRTLEQSNYRQVPIADLKKVSRAIYILQETNARLNKILKNMHAYYDKKYKCKIDELQRAIDRKDEDIAELLEENSPRFLFVVRNAKSVYLYEDFDRVNRACGVAGSRVVLCRFSKRVTVEKALCVTVAKSKCGKNVTMLADDTLEFVNDCDADSFETDVRVMFNN
ncbi:hypothetical protein [Alphabaculovirus myunipunctae]|uniref:Uncharacterized protein n=1 Tax=Mythimna unipuncta nucleopolyhedrovirus TaxID=447897 RepID=A0A2K9VS67_9ABAC|nr:hypothetical protein [Mythimna unipuncta nucleopolyhedrovirus]AUV65293.1 hypothetical protein [Mythimna unipuncta nucleopolyhedrovirus]